MGEARGSRSRRLPALRVVQALLPFAIPGSPGAQPSPRRPAAPSSRTNLLAGRREGAAASGASPAAASAPLSVGPGGAGTALPRPRAECAQPDAAQLCPRRRRRRRGRRALADMLSFRTCPRGSYQEPSAAGEAAPSCRAAATSWRRPRRRPREKGGEALLKIAPAEGSHPLPAHPLFARPRSELSGSGNWRSAGPLPWETVPQEQTPARVAKAESQLQAVGYGTPPRLLSPVLPSSPGFGALDRDIKKKKKKSGLKLWAEC